MNQKSLFTYHFIPALKLGEVSLSSDESRSRRLMRTIARASRRYHILERLSRRPQTQPATNGGTNGHIVNGNAHANGSHMLNGHNGVGNEYHNARVNGASQRNGVFVNGRGGDGSRTPPLPESIYQELSPQQAIPTPKTRHVILHCIFLNSTNVD